MNEINILEKIASHTHPALEKIEYDGWTVQFSNGYTHRANSVLPLENGIIPIEEKVLECEKLYKKHNLPCIFKMTESSSEGLEKLLENRFYRHEADTFVMTVSSDDENLQERMESIVEPEEIGVIITSCPDDEWLKAFFAFEQRTDSKVVRIASRQFEILSENENLNAFYCRVQMLGKDVAVASAVIEDGIMFLLNVVVDENLRGKGYGKILVKEVLEATCSFGAEKLCLQVVANNISAVRMYESFGFECLYKYWYMVK